MNIIAPNVTPPISPINNNLSIVTNGLSCSGDNQGLFLTGIGTSSPGPFKDSSYIHTERQLPLIATIRSGISCIRSSSLPADTTHHTCRICMDYLPMHPKSLRQRTPHRNHHNHRPELHKVIIWNLDCHKVQDSFCIVLN